MVNLYAKVTEELGIAPGGEFRIANNEVIKLAFSLFSDSNFTKG